MARTGKVILAKNINVDKNYKNVLAYTESEMYSLVYANKTSELTNCSFIRDDNSMEVGLSYATCQMANYLAFQNTSYSSKWFFAFIDKIEYVSNAVTRIYYTIDIWSSWYDYWDKKPCYIIRQHANTDVAGDNLVPEGLEHGEYISNSRFESTKFRNYFYAVVASISGSWDGSSFVISGEAVTKLGSDVLAGALYICNSVSDMYDLINAILAITSPQQGTILTSYLIPKDLFPSIDPATTNIYNIATAGYTVYTSSDEVFQSTPTSLNNYYPVNKKLLTYPYQYILASNNVGNTNVYRFEDFSTTKKKFDYFGVPTVGGSIIACPESYKNVLVNKNEALIGAKYPTIGWTEDAYTNWLTQNSVNNTVRNITTGGSLIIGGALLAASPFTGGSTALMGAGILASGTMSAIETAGEYYQHSIEPDSIKGMISAGDILTGLGQLSFDYYHMSIKQNYAQKLDKFFNKYGYKQNEVQTPLFGNDSYRKYWNYIQIASDEVAAIPKYNNTTGVIINANDLQMINNIFRAGVTIWKLNSTIGDFDYWNVIETPSNS